MPISLHFSQFLQIMQSQSQNPESSMADKTTTQKRGGSISEDSIAIVLQRYKATTVLDMLHEMAHFQDVKFDWNSLVKHTKTGIKNPREYQMLWRHLAYCAPLLEGLEDDAQPLDDDSDLEYELEAFPTVSNEATAEAAACVKVLIDSGSPIDSNLEKGLTIEAPLIINIPSENPQIGGSGGINITIPVSVPKQTLPTVSSAEGLDTSGCGNSNLPPRRKRKPWSADEDKELFAAVQKCGEGNWANILKGDFKGDRTASQLSQRWNIIKKRKSNSIVKTSSQLSEMQLAARRAINLALDKPTSDNMKSSSTLGRTSSGNISIQPTVTTTEPLQAEKKPFPRTQPQPFPTRPSGPDAVKAAAVAAGARIATQSAAAAILKAQLKGAIHIKTTAPGTTRPLPVPPPGGAHMGGSSSDYFRDRFPTSTATAPPRAATLGSTHVVGPVVAPSSHGAGDANDGSVVAPLKPSGSSPVEPPENRTAAVRGEPEKDAVVQVIGLKQEDQEDKQPLNGSSNPTNLKLES